MTIRKRLSRTNTRILLFALLSLLIISGIIIEIYESTYFDRMANYAKLEKKSVETVNFLDTYDFSEDNIDEFYEKIKQNNYQLYISKDGEQIYSDFSDKQEEEMQHLKKYVTKQKEADVFVWKTATMIFKSYKVEDITYQAVALKDEVDSKIMRTQGNQIRWLIPMFMATGILTIGIIVGISRYFSRKLENQIMEPIEKLIEAANRIEEGDFTERVYYQGEEEFEKLCQSFNTMQESLKEEIQRTEAYEKERTKMVAGISHDLRTPLTSIKGFIKGVKDKVANTPQKQEQYLDIAYQKACAMDVLLQELFFYSKLETGDMPLYRTNTNMDVFLQEMIAETQDELKENNADIIYLRPSISVNVNIDKEQMHRVIRNIVENSLKYRNKEHVMVQIHMICKEDNVVIKITDDGDGVPEDKLPHLFEQFYRGDETRNSKIDGDGLGLYIAKRIVEQHNGWIYASNSGGFCITIVLPLADKTEK